MIDKVFGANVLIEQIAEDETTKSGLILMPSNNGKKKNIGTVVKAGRGHFNFNGDIVPMEIQENDIVMFQPYAGTKILDEGKEYILVNEKDILLKLTK